MLEVVALDEGIKTAVLANMRKRHAGDLWPHVISGGFLIRRDLGHLVGGHIQKFRASIDKTPDQPGAGDAVNLGALTRDPARATACRLGKQGVLLFTPGLDAPFQVGRVNAEAAQSASSVLTDFVPMNAVHHHRLRGRQIRCPLHEQHRVAAQRARQHVV